MDKMDNDISYFELVKKCQLGDEESMNRLAELVQERVFAYIYRLTLNYELTQDLLQETLMDMVKSLKELKHPERFWGWMLRTAMGKVQHHYREQQRKRKLLQNIVLDKESYYKSLSQNHNDGLNYAARQELSEVIFNAISKLRFSYRNVLVLHCFEQMSYSEIAEVMGFKELRARVLFFRAKHSLKQHLARRGLSKQLLLIALGLFGLITTPTKAAATTSAINAASLEVGLLATIAGSLGTKLGIVLTSLIAAFVVMVTVKTVLYAVGATCLVLYVLFWVWLANLYRQ